MPPRNPAHSVLASTEGAIPRGGLIPALLLCLLLLFPTAIFAGQAPGKALAGYTWLTEEYYPYNYTENNTVKGISVDLLHMVWAELDMEGRPVESLPWARAYERLQHESQTVLFCMARTPEREHAFRWAGPIATVRFVLIARKNRHIILHSLRDIRGLSVGTLREDISDTLLSAYRDTASIQPVAHMRQNINKLMTNRLDLVAYEEGSWHKLADRYGLDPEDFETVYVLRETPVYFAFHLDTPEPLVTAFQSALDRVKSSPGYQELLDAYLR